MQINQKWQLFGHAVDPIGLASGYPATSSMNSFKMAVLVNELFLAYRESKHSLVEFVGWDGSGFSEQFAQLCFKRNVELTLEKSCLVFHSLNSGVPAAVDLLGFDLA